MLKNLTVMIFVSLTLVLPTAAVSEPLLRFSDLDSGPNTGNTDGVVEDHGAVVTLWGQHIETSGTVYIRDSADQVHEAAHVYYWKNADGTLPSGPANLFKYHHMSEIAFSIPSSTATGAAKMYVEVDGEQSNELDFLIRPGNIYFIDDSGEHTSSGNFTSPWKDANVVFNTNNGLLVAGDIVYFKEYTASNGFLIGHSPDVYYEGTQDAPFAIVGYPGFRNRVYTNGITDSISNKYGKNSYWNFAKLTLDTTSRGLASFYRMRAIGNEFTGTNATGYSGAIAGNGDQAGGGVLLGNHFHDFGDENTIDGHHTFYLSNRDGTLNEPYEIGWSVLENIWAKNGLHLYDQSDCGDWSGTFNFHDNFIINQRSCGINLGGGCSAGFGSFTYDVRVYNNIIVSENPEFPTAGICISSNSLDGHIYVFNNLIYGYTATGGGIGITNTFRGQSTVANNIIVDTQNVAYAYDSTMPDAYEANLFQSTVNPSLALPARWSGNAVAGSAQFDNVGTYQFGPTSNSAVINQGVSRSYMAGVTHDFYGQRLLGTMEVGPATFIQGSLNSTENLAPSILDYYPKVYKRLNKSNAIDFSLIVLDPEDDVLNYTWKVNGTIVGTQPSYAFNGSNRDLGYWNLSVLISDGNNTISHDWIYKLRQPKKQDLTDDDIVDMSDLRILAQHVIKRKQYKNSFDQNEDGRVNLFDLLSVVNEFGIY